MDLKTESDALGKIPMFAKLEPSKLRLLAFTSQSLTFDDGEILFNQGDPSDSAYVLLKGDTEVLVVTGERVDVAGVLGINELVGEMGVLANAPRSATIRARGQVVALRIEADMFLDLLAENPSVALDVMRQLSSKLARSHRRYEELQQETMLAGDNAGASTYLGE
ncbi:MAG: CRP/FNR family cyclic AMP-dependent transcriptional regulator [Gammaproteobacteria bacterium]|jgi:CRP/FNR family cyclic AMP-dependent transcriptional regulator